ncbi:MAG: methionine synthase [Candidatus Omnitrophica bacterium]|nr:methionine synthase [Candidatus Omnitrophota bacterium]
MVKPRIFTTGIGSLPHKDVEEALDLVFRYCPEAPFWPQLPKRSLKEGMLAQFTEGFPCLRFTEEGLLFEPQDKEKELEQFYARIIDRDTDYFRISSDYALGLYRFYERLRRINLKDISYIKCQLTGPFTLAASIKDKKGIALLHDKIFMQVILKGLLMKALWQIRFFKDFNKRIILFIDEPYLGSFGSAYVPVNRQEVVEAITELTQGIKTQDVLLGVHCCGNTDWSIFTDIAYIDIISFDAFSFLERLLLYTDNLKGFFKRAGILCWGIVPTQDFNEEKISLELLSRLKNALRVLSKKGIDKNLLLENLFLSPACGLGILGIKEAERVFRVLSEIASFFSEYLEGIFD